MPEITSYKPSGFYFRRAMRATDDPKKLRAIGMTMCMELEQLKEWIRDQGLVPPKQHIMASEAEEKGWQFRA